MPLRTNEVPDEEEARHEQRDAHPLRGGEPEVARVGVRGVCDAEKVHGEPGWRIHEADDHHVRSGQVSPPPQSDEHQRESDREQELERPEVIACEVAVDDRERSEGLVRPRAVHDGWIGGRERDRQRRAVRRRPTRVVVGDRAPRAASIRTAALSHTVPLVTAQAS